MRKLFYQLFRKTKHLTPDRTYRPLILWRIIYNLNTKILSIAKSRKADFMDWYLEREVR